MKYNSFFYQGGKTQTKFVGDMSNDQQLNFDRLESENRGQGQKIIEIF